MFSRFLKSIDREPEPEPEPELSPLDVSQNECINKFVKNGDSDLRHRYENICKIVNDIQITDNIQIINERFTELVHLWFNDNAILHSIYKHLRTKGVCILHEIAIWKNISNSGDTMYYVPINYGYYGAELDTRDAKNPAYYSNRQLDPEMYYNTQIRECPNDIMAIPIRLYVEGDDTSHSNMLIIRRYKYGMLKVLVEHFEPYFTFSNPNYSTEITQLVYSLFSYDPLVTKPKDILISSITSVCPMQHLLYSTKFANTCAIFALWYALKRLLNPKENVTTTMDNINKYLQQNNNTPEDRALVMKKIILSFMQLLDIDENGVINNKKKIDELNLDKINNTPISKHGGRKISSKKHKSPKPFKKYKKCKLSKTTKSKLNYKKSSTRKRKYV